LLKVTKSINQIRIKQLERQNKFAEELNQSNEGSDTKKKEGFQHIEAKLG